MVSSKSKWLVVNSQKLAAAADGDDADAEAARLVPLQSPPLESKGHSILLILDVLHAFYDKTTFFFSFFLSFFLSFFFMRDVTLQRWDEDDDDDEEEEMTATSTDT